MGQLEFLKTGALWSADTTILLQNGNTLDNDATMGLVMARHGVDYQGERDPLREWYRGTLHVVFEHDANVRVVDAKANLNPRFTDDESDDEFWSGWQDVAADTNKLNYFRYTFDLPPYFALKLRMETYSVGALPLRVRAFIVPTVVTQVN